MKKFRQEGVFNKVNLLLLLYLVFSCLLGFVIVHFSDSYGFSWKQTHIFLNICLYLNISIFSVAIQREDFCNRNMGLVFSVLYLALGSCLLGFGFYYRVLPMHSEQGGLLNIVLKWIEWTVVLVFIFISDFMIKKTDNYFFGHKAWRKDS